MPSPTISVKKTAPYLYPPPPQFTDPQRRAQLETAFPQLGRHFQEYQEQNQIPGLAWGIVIDNELAYSEALGLRDVQAQAPVTHDTVFRIASMSKSFVAMAILRLRDEKKLRLDDPVAKYIPELKRLAYPTTDSPVLTLRHFLTMSPGFPEDNPWGDRQMGVSDQVLNRWLRAGIPFANAPGVTFEYSNYAYALLGRIITRVSGTSFQKYIARHIFKPLGMNSTTWDLKKVPPERLALAYRYQDEAFVREPIVRDGAFAAMAGIFTTIPDFARYMMFLLNAFPPRDETDKGPVKRSTAREMQQLMRHEELAVRPSIGDVSWHAAVGYGFGLAVWHDEYLGYGVSHGGGLPGYGSYYYLLPNHGVGLVAFTNKTYSRIGMPFSRALAELMRTGGLHMRRVQPAAVLIAHRDIVQNWLETGEEAALIACAADNFFLDRDIEHRRTDMQNIRRDLGLFLSVGEVQVTNPLRGKWTVELERGTLEVVITLAPTMPPSLQMLALVPKLREVPVAG